MKKSRMLAPLSAALVIMAAPTAADAVDGFQGPIFRIDTAPNGDILMADANTGVLAIRDGQVSVEAAVPGATDVSAIGRGSFWVSTGAAEDPEADTGQGLHRVSKGRSHKLVNLFEFEATVNPECGSGPDCVLVFDGGFTSIIDLTFGPDGSLYVAELDEASWAAVEILQAPTGGTINACDIATLTCGEVASGIPILTAITFGKDGTLWATRNALTPGQAEVFEVS
jgi:hypothetical protein